MLAVQHRGVTSTAKLALQGCATLLLACVACWAAHCKLIYPLDIRVCLGGQCVPGISSLMGAAEPQSAACVYHGNLCAMFLYSCIFLNHALLLMLLRRQAARELAC